MSCKCLDQWRSSRHRFVDLGPKADTHLGIRQMADGVDAGFQLRRSPSNGMATAYGPVERETTPAK